MNLFNSTASPFGFAAVGQANAQPYGMAPQAPQAGQMSAFGQQPQDPNMAAMANQRAMFDAQRLGSQNPPMPNMAYMQGAGAAQPMLQGSLAAPGGGMPPMTQSDLAAMMRASSPMAAPGSLSAAPAGGMQGVVPLGSSMPGAAASGARPTALPDFSGLRGLRARQEMMTDRMRGKRGRG